MRKKQLFALLMAGALSVGMAPTATFAADTAASGGKCHDDQSWDHWILYFQDL